MTPLALLLALAPIEVQGQPLGANALRLGQALESLGAPLPAGPKENLRRAAASRNARTIQTLIDPYVLVAVTISPESRVKAQRGPAPARLQQAGFTPVIIKVINEAGVTAPLRMTSAQSGPVYAGVAQLSMERQQQVHLRKNENTANATDRFLDLEMVTSQPMTPTLSGLAVEYVLGIIYSSESGAREATLGFDVGQGTQDLGFRAEVPVLFEVRPAIVVKLSILDHDGKPTTGRFTFHDRAGHVFPPQPKRLAPDLFFQQQIYRHHGQTVLLPPGELTMSYGRGPEYRVLQRRVTIPSTKEAEIAVKLQRWVDPAAFGFYSGDHHIHAAGCAHYTAPTEGVLARDMFLQVKGEGLNVGSILTWGPCFNFQRQFFSPSVDRLSEPMTVIKYDVEVSGFGSQALGHVCLLNLKKQSYPGSDGINGWPTWTTPTLRWAKQQGAVTGYAHSASGIGIDPPAAARRLLTALDADHDGRLTGAEASAGLLPEFFGAIDADRDGVLVERELIAANNRAADRLPNLAIPEMNGVGAMEIGVSVAHGVVDFISAMDTARIQEWNMWYHLLNSGFSLKVSGETDFPCMSGARVGQGRTYVQLGKVDRIDFVAWSAGLAQGRSYVSDGYAHALDLTVDGKPPGSEIRLASPATVTIKAKVAFAAETPLGVAHGGVVPTGGVRLVGDTVNLHEHEPRPPEGSIARGKRLVELVVNGNVAAAREVPADDQVHEVAFAIPIGRSSWVALRHFPQMHTNPVNVLVAGKPIRASRQSALWVIGTIEQLWRVREKKIDPKEHGEAALAFRTAIETYRRIAAEAAD